MASKASKLQSGAKKTSFGLFDGMPKLDEKTKAESKEKSVSTEPKKSEKTEEVKASEKPQTQPKETPAKESAEQPVLQEEVIEKTVEQPTVNAPGENRRDIVLEEPIQDVQPKETLLQEPQQVQQTPIINQPQVQVTPQPQVQTYIPQPQIQQSQVYQQPAYTAYQQPMNSMPQMPYMQQPIQAQYNEPKRATRAEKGEKSSRYEKDKFLLLDIRGLRDYVEHMAKASNMSATKYIRSLIEKDWAANNDIYMAHKALEEQLRQKNNLG